MTTWYANLISYSSITAHEVIFQVSNKCLEIRRMKAKLLNGADGEQRYKFSQDESQKIFRVRLHKDGHCYDIYGNRYKLETEPREHYNYKF